jgi:hypothetical protein
VARLERRPVRRAQHKAGVTLQRLVYASGKS